ncbi:MAG: hypothetical protein AAFX06_21775 [Planctomycetota bacterium]
MAKKKEGDGGEQTTGQADKPAVPVAEPKPKLSDAAILMQVAGMGKPAAERLAKKMDDEQRERVRQCFGKKDGSVRKALTEIRGAIADAEAEKEQAKA